MKKSNAISVFFSLLLFFTTLSTFNLNAQIQESDPIKFECNITVQVTSNGTFVRSACTNHPGDCCNAPGSVHRIEVPTFGLN